MTEQFPSKSTVTPVTVDFIPEKQKDTDISPYGTFPQIALESVMSYGAIGLLIAVLAYGSKKIFFKQKKSKTLY